METTQEMLGRLREAGTGVVFSCAECLDSCGLCVECYFVRKDVLTAMKCKTCKDKTKKEYRTGFLDRQNSADRSKRYRERKKAEKKSSPDNAVEEENSSLAQQDVCDLVQAKTPTMDIVVQDSLPQPTSAPSSPFSSNPPPNQPLQDADIDGKKKIDTVSPQVFESDRRAP
jgi:hypothetical protein